MMATLFVQPLDLVKNRMQLQGVGAKSAARKSTFSVIQSVVKEEGLFAMYTGLSAGLMRQATYTTTRLGTYAFLFEKFTKYVRLFITF
jgi:solute carrier family 25 oxoglutarate transporter 11